LSQSVLRVLCVNGGSSSLKVALFEYAADGGEKLLVRGGVDGLSAGVAKARLRLRDGAGKVLRETTSELADVAAAVQAVLDVWAELQLPAPDVVGHRIVHGGADHSEPRLIDQQLMAALRRLVAFAPLHMPPALAAIDAVRARFPQLPHVACFDTAFHRGMPELAQRLPLPRALWDAGVRRYGFHGLSYEFVVQQLGAAVRGKLIIAHLGNGVSMSAIRDGKPVDTTMGFTPTGGVMMGTRTGDLDPGVLVYLMQTQGYDATSVEKLVNHGSGLLGVSGSTGDVKTLLEKRDQDPHAAEALALFCYQLCQQVGAFAATLGGLDGLVFTGGIGEHAWQIRQAVCEKLQHLGVLLDAEQNRRDADVISTHDSTCTVRVIATDEERTIARHARTLLMSQAEQRG
jgi:acetate kinase